MYSLIFFLVLTLAQYGFYIWKKSEVSDYQETATSLANFTTVDTHQLYKKSIIFLSNVVNIFKRFLWPAVIILLFINLMVSIIIGTVTFYIVNIF
jgi:hypothetical protein